MAEDNNSHITVTYRTGSLEYTEVYAINDNVLRELDRHTEKPTGESLQKWLKGRGCGLDSQEGPAIVMRTPDGWMFEGYYRNGKPHREDGPAYIERYADGETEERYYRDGIWLSKDKYYAETNPLLTGLRLPPMTNVQDAIDTLLRDAIVDQSTPVKPSPREYVPIPRL